MDEVLICDRCLVAPENEGAREHMRRKWWGEDAIEAAYEAVDGDAA